MKQTYKNLCILNTNDMNLPENLTEYDKQDQQRKVALNERKPWEKHSSA
jgi:hypothetical protein